MATEVTETPNPEPDFDPLIPDSELDPPVGVDEKFYVIQDGGTVGVLPNDWVDVDEGVIGPDAEWGFSFQVIECFDDYLTIKVKNLSTGFYEEIYITPSVVTNNFRRVPKT